MDISIWSRYLPCKYETCINAIVKGVFEHSSPCGLFLCAIYLIADWNELFTTKCFACGFPIEAGDRWVEALSNNYHSQCFNCTVSFWWYLYTMLTLFWVFDIERKHVHILTDLVLPLLLFIYLENCSCMLGIHSFIHLFSFCRSLQGWVNPLGYRTCHKI